MKAVSQCRTQCMWLNLMFLVSNIIKPIWSKWVIAFGISITSRTFFWGFLPGRFTWERVCDWDAHHRYGVMQHFGEGLSQLSGRSVPAGPIKEQTPDENTWHKHAQFNDIRELLSYYSHLFQSGHNLPGWRNLDTSALTFCQLLLERYKKRMPFTNK